MEPTSEGTDQEPGDGATSSSSLRTPCIRPQGQCHGHAEDTEMGDARRETPESTISNGLQDNSRACQDSEQTIYPYYSKYSRSHRKIPTNFGQDKLLQAHILSVIYTNLERFTTHSCISTFTGDIQEETGWCENEDPIIEFPPVFKLAFILLSFLCSHTLSPFCLSPTN